MGAEKICKELEKMIPTQLPYSGSGKKRKRVSASVSGKNVVGEGAKEAGLKKKNKKQQPTLVLKFRLGSKQNKPACLTPYHANW